MSSGQEPYDPYIPSGGGGGAAPGGAGNTRTQALQAVSLFERATAFLLSLLVGMGLEWKWLATT